MMKNLETPLAKQQRNLGVVRPRLLESRVVVQVQTGQPRCFFEMELGVPRYGVVLLASDYMPSRDKVVYVGSKSPETGEFLPDIIGLGMCMVMRNKEGEFATGKVLACKVVGPSYTYDVWQNWETVRRDK